MSRTLQSGGLVLDVLKIIATRRTKAPKKLPQDLLIYIAEVFKRNL